MSCTLRIRNWKCRDKFFQDRQIKIQLFYGLNVCIPSNSHVEILMPDGLVLGVGLWRGN